MIKLDAASVLLQWATGGLLFLWVTTRHRVVGLGYGWLIRGVYALMAAGALWIGLTVIEPLAIRDISSAGVAVSATVALVVSIMRRRAGVEGQRLEHDRKMARVSDMTGIDRADQAFDDGAPEFPPALDLIAPLIGVVGLVAAGATAGDPVWLSIARMLVGAAFLGVIFDAMLLGHWYLVQPGLARAPLLELVKWVMIIWPFEIILLLVPIGMVSVLNGSIDDGYNGILGWFWVASAITTIGLAIVTRAALREPAYAAVMAATGLLYLAILTGFGTDLVARALLA